MTPAARAREIVNGCGHCAPPAGYIEGACEACIAAALAAQAAQTRALEDVHAAARRYARWRRVGNALEEQEAWQLLDDALMRAALTGAPQLGS